MADTFKPPASVAKEAKKAIEWRKQGVKWGTPVGHKRASQLASRQPVSLNIIKRMVAYFDRHEADKDSDAWKNDKPASKGKAAWAGWGGNAGRTWAKSILNKHEKSKDTSGMDSIQNAMNRLVKVQDVSQRVPSKFEKLKIDLSPQPKAVVTYNGKTTTLQKLTAAYLRGIPRKKPLAEWTMADAALGFAAIEDLISLYSKASEYLDKAAPAQTWTGTVNAATDIETVLFVLRALDAKNLYKWASLQSDEDMSVLSQFTKKPLSTTQSTVDEIYVEWGKRLKSKR